jgi:hypothetical protein
MTKVQVPRTKSHINEREVVLVTPKTGMLLQIPLPPSLEAGPAAQLEHEELRGLFQEIVDHLNATTGDAA